MIPPKPALDPGLVDHVAQVFGVRADEPARDLGGSSSLNVAIGDFVVRVHRSSVPAERLEALQEVRRRLRADGLPLAETIGVTRWREHLVEVERRLEGEPMDTWDRLLAGMAALGRVHASLARFGDVSPAARVAPVTNQIPFNEVVPAAREAAATIRSWPDPTPEELAAAAATEALADRVEVPDLPRQLVHGDFWDNNVLFGPDSAVAGILDLDFVAERHRIDDLALVLYYVRSTSPTAPGKLRELVDAYDDAADPHLDARERAALPVALARMVLGYARHLLQRDDAAAQREVLRAWAVDLDWSAGVLDDLGAWQRAFARS